MLLAMLVAERLLFLLPRFWVQVFHPLKTQYHRKVSDSEHALNPGRQHQIFSSYPCHAGALAVFSASLYYIRPETSGCSVWNRTGESHSQVYTCTCLLWSSTVFKSWVSAVGCDPAVKGLCHALAHHWSPTLISDHPAVGVLIQLHNHKSKLLGPA